MCLERSIRVRITFVPRLLGTYGAHEYIRKLTRHTTQLIQDIVTVKMFNFYLLLRCFDNLMNSYCILQTGASFSSFRQEHPFHPSDLLQELPLHQSLELAQSRLPPR